MNVFHLSTPPIVEGLIDIQVSQQGGPSGDEALTRLRDELKQSFPEAKEMQSIEAGFEIKEGKAAGQSFAATKIGFRLERKNPSTVILLRRNGFTFSRLKPYDNWESLVSEARPIWERYCAFSHPESITRVATRFINRLELPIRGLDFEDYLTAMPRLPKGLPESLSGFLVRLIIPDKETGAEIGIVQALESPNMEKQVISVLLDIDVFKAVNIDPSSHDELWKLLDSLRHLKNKVFFGSITDKALGLFK